MKFSSVINTYRDVSISSVRLKATGQTIKYDGSSSNDIQLTVVVDDRAYPKIKVVSGVSQNIPVLASGRDHGFSFSVVAGFPDDAPAPGTRWQITIESIEATPYILGTYYPTTNEVVTVSGLPLISGEISW